MAEAEAPSKGKGLGKRVGPLPVWGWAVIIVGGFLGIMIVRKYAGGGAAQGLSVGGVGQPTSSDPGATAPPGVSTSDFSSALDSLTKQFTASQTQLASEITQSNQDQAAANKSLADSMASALTSAVGTLQGEINQKTITTPAPLGQLDDWVQNALLQAQNTEVTPGVVISQNALQSFQAQARDILTKAASAGQQRVDVPSPFENTTYHYNLAYKDLTGSGIMPGQQYGQPA